MTRHTDSRDLVIRHLSTPKLASLMRKRGVPCEVREAAQAELDKRRKAKVE